ncbi:MAG: restriction endonuclease subunit S [Candidatus Delongbacteria bacterium]|nr:restriction endonuclease subunit S [Candidatus Delongbacteria bacterium]
MRKDWVEVEFENLLDYIQPTNYIVKDTEYKDVFKTPVLTAGKSFILGYTNETDGIFKNLPVIIFDDFTTATKYVNFEFKVKSSAMKILAPTSKKVNLKYVFYGMQVIHESADTHKRYWISVYAKKQFPLAPLPEQRAIVSKIELLFSELDNAVSNLKQAKDKIEIFRQSVLKKAFEGELTKEWREKQNDLPSAKQLIEQIKLERQNYCKMQIKAVKSNVEENEEYLKNQNYIVKPESWAYLILDKCVSKLGDGLHGTPNYYEDEYYFVNGNNLINGKIVIKKDTKKVNFEEYKKHKRDLNERTILVSINGTLGNVAFYNNEKIILGKSACYFNVFDFVNKKYLYYILRSEYFLKYALDSATGSTIKNVSLKSMRDFPVLYPPVHLQNQFAEIVNKIEEQKAFVKRAIDETQYLFDCLISEYFE